MAQSLDSFVLLGGKLSLDFANLPSQSASPPSEELSWEQLISFLQASGIVSEERATRLFSLSEEDPAAASRLLARAHRLRDALRAAFMISLEGGQPSESTVAPVNQVLSVTEGHDALVWSGTSWQIEFVAREEGLDWLLAAVARSAAELIAEGHSSPLRRCGNPACSLFFYDNSRTHRRRWCSMSLCGNRSKVAAFARRNAQKPRAKSATA